MFKNIAKDHITIIKPNGDKFECYKADVQSEKIFIWCGDLNLEENDIIIHHIDNKRIQEFIVIDRGYRNSKHFGNHFQAKVMRKDEFEKSIENIPKIQVTGDNSYVNINSVDSSLNYIDKSETSIFNEIREKLEKELDEEDIKKEALIYLDAMENAKDKNMFKENYMSFTSVLANHITIIAAFIPLLIQFL